MKSRVLQTKLIVAKLVTKFPVAYEIGRRITLKEQPFRFDIPKYMNSIHTLTNSFTEYKVQCYNFIILLFLFLYIILHIFC
jgi:hypothetical protein